MRMDPDLVVLMWLLVFGRPITNTFMSRHFTVIGVWRNRRRLIIPWLLVQGLLAALLCAMAVYYLVIFPGEPVRFDSQVSKILNTNDFTFWIFRVLPDLNSVRGAKPFWYLSSFV